MSSLRRLVPVIATAKRAARFEALARFRTQPIRTDRVLYESFAGSGALCNPEAIFRELLANRDMSKLRHVWVLDRAHRDAPIVREFHGDHRVRFVTRDSVAYLRAVSTSKYLINNATFPSWFAKRPRQIYLNTWHGTPLKTMGADMPNGGREGGNTLRNFAQADFLLSQNAFMTEQMYGSAYKLNGLYRGLVIEEGYPRVDRQSLDDAGRTRVEGRLSAAGLPLAGRRLVLYAPTWHGDRFADPADDIDELVERATGLQRRLGDDFAVRLKTHQALDRFVGDRADLRAILVPSDLPTNQVLGITDTLVTDYSSIFFDFLATGRRIIFHVPDGEAYDTSRGRYFADDELPGPVTLDLDSLAVMVRADEADPELRSDIRRQWKVRFTPHPSGSTKRVVDVVFRQNHDARGLRDLSGTTRRSLLLHVGSLASNGITASALNLLAALPAEQYDVSVAYTRSASTQQEHNAGSLPTSVRQFPRDGGMNGTKWRHLLRRLAYRRGQFSAHRSHPRQRRLWDDEWIRCFGDARFDVVVDFSGYSPLWTTLLLHSPDARRSIWLHNDMAAEAHRRVGTRRPLATSIPAIVGLYPEYDDAVAVSPTLASVNEASLRPALPHGRPIRSALNLIDADRVRSLAAARPFADEPLPTTGLQPEWVSAFERRNDCVWFVTVGRYTREKNQTLLLKAFARIHAEDARARLLLIGHGPLAGELCDMIDRLGLAGVAFVTGPLRNPFSVMRSADCFVLSSDYEGQPMVLLEAAVLGLPIVCTDFATIRDALPEGSMHVVPSDVAGLTSGLRAYLLGRVPSRALDAPTYNATALAQFLRAVGEGSRTPPNDAGQPHRTPEVVRP